MNIENYADAVLAKKMLEHRGHVIKLVTYGADDSNVALECGKCHVVLLDYEITNEDLHGEFSDAFYGKHKEQS